MRACGRHYPDLIADLEGEGEGDTGYDRCGLLTLALADWDRPAFDHLREMAFSRAADGGTGRLSDVDPDDARRRFPALGPVTAALLNPDAARVDGRRITTAILASARRHGLAVVDAEADRLVLRSGRVAGVDAAGRTLTAGAVVIAGGAWSPPLVAPLDTSLPVGPQRGQIVHLRAAGVETGDWPIAQPVLGHYLVPWPGGRVAVGATREPDAGFAAAPTAAGMRQVLNEVSRVAPGLLDATFEEVRVGLRPVSADDLPVLGPLDRHPNVHVATGYGANGLLLAPWCGELVAGGILAAVPGKTQPFGPSRFAA